MSSSRLQKYALIALIAIMLVPDTCDAQLRRRRRRQNGFSSGYLVAPLAAVAKPLVGLIRERSLFRNEYDYNWAARRDWHQDDAQPMLFADRVRVNLLMTDEHAEQVDRLKVRARWTYLHKSQTEHTAWLDVEQKDDLVYFDLPELEEGRLVKIRTDLYLATDEEPPGDEALENASFVVNDEGNFKFTGAMHAPYYGVTSSEDDEELKRRAHIVSFSFSQWYADEAYGGRYCHYDCYSFYQTSAGGELEGFELQPISHSQVPELAKNGKRFHGDYLIMPGHYGMALCYDEDTGNFCTIEGNYALYGPYRINIDPSYHGLYTWSSIMTISEQAPQETVLMN